MKDIPRELPAAPGSIDSAGSTRTSDYAACLQRLALALLNAATVAQVAEAVASIGLSALNAATGVICLLSDDGAHLEALHTFGLSLEDARQYARFPLDAPLFIAAAARQQELLFAGPAPRPDARKLHSSDTIRSHAESASRVAAPLMFQGSVAGAIGITFTGHAPLDAADCAYLEALTQMAAPALENVRRYEAECGARKAAEQKLTRKKQESDEQTRDFFGNLTDGFVGYDRQWRIMYVNKAGAATVQMDPEDLMGRVIWDIFPDLVDSDYHAACYRVVAERIPLHRDDFWPRYNIWIENHIFPIDNGVAIMFRDITANRRAEVALRAAERQLRLITDASPVLITYIDVNQRFQFVNRAYAEWFGIPADQIVGKSIREIIQPDAYEVIAGYIAEALAGQSVTFERSVADGGSHLRHIYASYVPDIGESGAVRGFVGVVTDITERKKLETQLRGETESLETINRLGQRLSAELDLDRLIQDATDAATRLTGAQFGAFFYDVIDPNVNNPDVIDPEEENYRLYTISGVPRELFSRFPLPRNTALFAATFSGEGTVRLDDVTQDPRYGRNAPYDGKPPGHLPVASYLAVSLISRSGTVLGGLFLGHEQAGVFTERHERIVEGLAAQAAIAIDNARLFLAERERSDQLALAISEVHHRVKNSLQAVAALLEMQIPDDESVMPVEAARDSLSQIKTIALVHDLLAHDQPIGMVDVGKVLTNLAKLLSQGMRTDDNPLPIQVRADPVEVPTKSATSLALVVNELLTNAAKHNVGTNTNGAASPAAIEVSLTCADENIVVIVRDHGPGFPSDFDPARHAHIGLQLVQTLVSHDLRGRITFGNVLAADGAQIEGAKIEISFSLSSLTV